MTWSISIPVITTISTAVVSISLARKKEGISTVRQEQEIPFKAKQGFFTECALLRHPQLSGLRWQCHKTAKNIAFELSNSYLLFKYSFGENYQVGEIKWFWRNISLSKENVPVAELISSDAQHGWSYLEITMRLYESFSNTVPDMSMPTPPYSSYTDVAMARLLWCAASDLRFLFFYF